MLIVLIVLIVLVAPELMARAVQAERGKPCATSRALQAERSKPSAAEKGRATDAK